MMMTMIGFNKQ